jgi:hypothetical protein
VTGHLTEKRLRLMIGSHDGSHHNVAREWRWEARRRVGNFLISHQEVATLFGRFRTRSSGGSEWRCVESSLSRELEMLALFKSDLTFACFKEVMKCSSSDSFYAALS